MLMKLLGTYFDPFGPVVSSNELSDSKKDISRMYKPAGVEKAMTLPNKDIPPGPPQWKGGPKHSSIPNKPPRSISIQRG
jgi:hypothetical protein